MDSKDKKFAILVLLLILLPFTTTLLLDWAWVQQQTARKLLVYMLITLQVVAFVYAIIIHVRQSKIN